MTRLPKNLGQTVHKSADHAVKKRPWKLLYPQVQ